MRTIIIERIKIAVISSISFISGCNGDLDNTEPYPFDLDLVREIAGREELPVSISRLKVAEGKFPCFWKVPGKCINGEIEFSSFIIEFDNYSVVIDPVHDWYLHQKFMFGGSYDNEAYNTLQNELLRSSHIIFTHEHWDHAAGALRSENFNEIEHKITLTREQVDSPLLRYSFKSEEQNIDDIEIIENDGYYSFLPGVVLIRAPGHSPGSQLIFVRLSEGKEFLFVGDVSYSHRNIKENVGKPWITSVINEENDKYVSGQIKMLAEIDANVIIVVAHDIQHISEIISKGLVSDFKTGR